MRPEQYKRQVLDHLRRWLVEGEREVPFGTGGACKIFLEDVRLEAHEGEDTVAVSFRIEGDGRLFGFRMEAAESEDPSDLLSEDPEGWAEIILINLDEAILVGSRSKPDSQGTVWVY